MGSYSYLNPNGVFNNQSKPNPFMQPNQPYPGGPTQLSALQQDNSLGYTAIDQPITPMVTWGNQGPTSNPGYLGGYSNSNNLILDQDTSFNPIEIAKPDYSSMGLSGHQWDTSNAADVEAGFDWSSLANTKGLGGTLLGVGNLAISGFNSWMNAKNQKFMQNYYGKQQTMQEKERVAAVTDSNRQISERGEDYAINTGNARGSQGFKDATAAYMDKWRVA